MVRSTSLLRAIRAKYKEHYLIWLTEKPAQVLLEGNSLIDKVLTLEAGSIEFLKSLELDVILNIDKSIQAGSLVENLQAPVKLGFTISKKTGAILPLNESAKYLWSLGLDNSKKFFENTRSEVQLQIEALELLTAESNDYRVELKPEEINLSLTRAKEFQKDTSQPVIGINTGCSPVIPYKKLTIEYHRRLILELQAEGYKNIVLLGGPEDSARNKLISENLDVVESPTNLGMRDGLVSVAACDIVLSGDSLGMHMAIALKKWVVAWFGPTCAHEIELYGQGEKLLSQSPCSPCWKRVCQKSVMCYDQVELREWISAVRRGEQVWQKKFSMCKPHFSEISV